MVRKTITISEAHAEYVKATHQNLSRWVQDKFAEEMKAKEKEKGRTRRN